MAPTLRTPPLTLRRDRNFRRTSMELCSPLAFIQIQITSRLNARQRRAIGMTFFRQLRPWLEYFHKNSMSHMDDGYVPHFRRDEERGLDENRAPEVATSRGRFGFEVRTRRLELGMTQTQLAHASHTTRARISLLERGLSNPRKKTQELLAAALWP